jgi:hypothetical protein
MGLRCLLSPRHTDPRPAIDDEWGTLWDRASVAVTGEASMPLLSNPPASAFRSSEATVEMIARVRFAQGRDSDATLVVAQEERSY